LPLYACNPDDFRGIEDLVTIVTANRRSESAKTRGACWRDPAADRERILPDRTT
jgi:hypothetical protein